MPLLLFVSVAGSSFAYAASMEVVLNNGDNFGYLCVARTVWTDQPFYEHFIDNFFVLQDPPVPLHTHGPFWSIVISLPILFLSEITPTEIYVFAVGFSSTCAGLAAVGFAFLLRKRAGARTAIALFGTAVLVTLPEFLYCTASALTEPVYLALLFPQLLLFWMCVERGTEEGRQSEGGAALPIGAGILLGLMYLTRANTIFVGALEFATLGWMIVRSWRTKREGIWRPAAVLRDPMIFGISFAAVLTPWLIRNTIVLGSPFASGYSHWFWLDHNDLGVWASPPSSEFYFERHTRIDYLRRWLTAERMYVSHFFSPSILPFTLMALLPVRADRKDTFFGKFLFLVMLLEALLSGFGGVANIHDRHLLMTTSLIIILGIAGLSRFLSEAKRDTQGLPAGRLMGFLLLLVLALVEVRHRYQCAALVFYWIWGWLDERRSRENPRRGGRLAVGLSIFVAGILAWFLATALAFNIHMSRERATYEHNTAHNRIHMAVGAWMEENVGPGDVVMMSYARTPTFYAGATGIQPPSDSLEVVLERYDVEYFVDYRWDAPVPEGFERIEQISGSTPRGEEWSVNVYQRNWTRGFD